MIGNSRPRSGWDLVRRGPFSRVFWAGFISSTGDWAALFAQISLADFIAGSQGILVVLAARLTPGLLGGAIGGVLADRARRKGAILFADFGRALLVLSLAFIDTLPELFIVSFALELLTLIGQPARAAIVPDLVGPDNLLTANGLTLSAAYGTFPLGAALAWGLGLLGSVTFFGLLPDNDEAVLFAADSLTFFISGLLMLSVPIVAAAVSEERLSVSRFDWRAPLRDFVDGVRFVALNPMVRPVIVGMSVALFGGGMLVVLGKGFSDETLNAGAAGFFALLFALGTGAAVGVVLLSIYGDRFFRRDVLFGVALTVTGVGLAAAALIKTVAGGMGWLAVMGLGAGSAYVTGFTHLHEQVEDDMRGRTFAALFSLMRVGLLVSMVVATNLVAVIPGGDPARVILFAGGLIVLAAGAGTLWTVRAAFGRPKLSPEGRESIEAAGRAFFRFPFRDQNEAPDDEESE